MTSIIANHYRILAELGKGGMGTVYKAEDTLTENIVAIKRLNPELTAPDLIERFRREGEALRELNHPNIVKMLDAVEENGNHYLIIEYLGGGDLNGLLKQGQLPVEKVLSIGIDICDALTRAHRLNIIHRDLKPANVLIAKDGKPRLTDFGIAHFAGKARITDSDVIIGTVDYLAPEILDGEGVDPRADIWAFGVMLFEMLTGSLPFTGQSLTQTLLAIATQPTPDLESLCPDAPIVLIDLIYRMLEKDRHARIASVRHVGAELEDILQGRTGAKHQASDTTRFATPTPDFLRRPKHNLPAQTTPFVGRETELTELAKLLDNPIIRLITIVAQGGMGKTRLALELAESYMPPNALERGKGAGFSSGIYVVELAPLSDHHNIIAAIANATGYQFQGDGREQKQQVCDFLSNKNMLLVMDNYEHLLEGAPLVTDILKAAPQLKVLAASRERLNLLGETVFNLEGMDFPSWETPDDAMEYAAVKLFLQGAKRAKPDSEVTAENMDGIARICKLVEGMPLGILLAASWVAMLSPDEIAVEITKSIDFLESAMSDMPARQRSMRAVFDYSWDLLTDDERAVFMKLSVFRGGFIREAAEAVTGAKLRILMSLMNKSLLRRDAESGRFDIHELLRQYAEDHLSKSDIADIVRETHSNYYLKALEEHELELIGPKGLDFLNKMESDIENVRAAMLWAAQHSHYAAINSALHSIWTYFHIRSQFIVGNKLFEQLANYIRIQPQTAERDATHLHLLARQIRGYIWLRDKVATKRYTEAARTLLSATSPMEVQAFFVLQEGLYLLFFQSRQIARSYLEQAVILYRNLGNEWGETEASHWLSTTYGSQEILPDLQVEEAINQQVVDRLKARGDILWLGRAVRNQANIAVEKNNYEQGKQLYFEALSYAERANNKTVQATIWRNLAAASHEHHQFEAAIDFYKKAAVLNRETGNIRHTLSIIQDITTVYSQLGQYQEVEMHMLEALSLAEGSEYRDAIRETNIRLAETYCVLGNYSQAQQFIERGFDIAVEGDNQATLAWMHFRVGQVYLWSEVWTAAHDHFERSRQLCQNAQLEFDIHELETSLAQLFYYTEDYQKAIETAHRSVDFIQAATDMPYREHFLVPALNILSMALCSVGQSEEAQPTVIEALILAKQSHSLWLQGQTLAALAIWLTTQHPVRAVEIAALIQTEPRFAAYDKRDAARLLDTLQSKLPLSDYRAAFEHGQTLELEAVLQALLTEFGENQV